MQLNIIEATWVETHIITPYPECKFQTSLWVTVKSKGTFEKVMPDIEHAHKELIELTRKMQNKEVVDAKALIYDKWLLVFCSV